MNPPSSPAARHLPRLVAAEFLGTGLLVATVVGSGIAAQRLSPSDLGLQLLENSTATAFGLAVLIMALAPVSGAHFNPVVSAVDALLNRGRARLVAPYIAAQVAGAIGGSVLANMMFDLPTAVSAHDRVTPGHVIAEVVATAGLVLVVFGLIRTGQAKVVGPAVGAWIGAAYWFTSSTSFANPAVTIGRIFTNTFAGIAPLSAAWFLGPQLIGGAVGAALVHTLFPQAHETPSQSPSD